MRNLSIDELAETMVDSILSETFLNKATLVPKVKALLRTAVDLKNVPKNYNAYETKSDQARRLRTIERKETELKFWLSKVRALDGGNIEKYYSEKDELMKEKGFD